eukprot:CAMPEP_0174374944 /NCGR_PEP_ID=MMETSP0811_2-20130205/112738_1 /TAXON_ID=73025 ORGANISM="Eutreptiella gymnastica-like, Strain CCMP1594" /NCGR_SAMPLE_ID=MMETSP0811_2 /ASSEMBLY_ACC=CAM_ASM_000667 /LENGTH=67 /DNA_ID=CAMNT_0015524689 /DNA_START=263 /DNA_END=463 /DNA_ORIENTATION=-
MAFGAQAKGLCSGTRRKDRGIVWREASRNMGAAQLPPFPAIFVEGARVREGAVHGKATVEVRIGRKW